MPVWLTDALSGVAATVVSSSLLYLVHQARGFVRWLKSQADIIEAIDRAGAHLAVSAHALGITAARLERAAQELAQAERRTR